MVCGVDLNSTNLLIDSEYIVLYLVDTSSHLSLKGNVQARTAIELEENERFAPTVAASLVGNTTKDGWTVIEATNDGPQRIWLTLEKGE